MAKTSADQCTKPLLRWSAGTRQLRHDVKSSEARHTLEDGEERPGDGNAAGDVAFLGAESVSSAGRLEEEAGEIPQSVTALRRARRDKCIQSKEDEDLGENAGLGVCRVNTECLKGGQEDKDNGPLRAPASVTASVEMKHGKLTPW